MEFTLRDALNMEALKDVKIVAGMQGLNREVRSANIIEVPEVSHWMRGGELLFSAGYAFGGDDQRGCELIADLKQREIAGLAIKPGKYLKQITQPLIDCANTLGFPLLEIPHDKPYSDLIEPIYTKLLNDHTLLLENIAGLHEKLLEAVLNGSFDELCSVLSKSLNKPIFLFDHKGGLILSKCGNLDYKSLQKLFDGYIQRHNTKTSDLLKWACSIDKCRHYFLCIPVYMQMELYFYLVMETTAAIPDEIDPIALKYTATLISLELMKKQALIEKEQQVGGELLSNLLEKRYDDEEVIIRRGAMLHFNLSLPLVVFTINVSHTECKAEDYEKCNVMLGEAKKNLRERLHWQMLNAGKGLIMLEKSDSIVGLLEVEPSDSIHGIQKMLCITLEKMNQKFPRIKLIAGIGRIYRGLSSIPTSYKESLAAAKVGMSIQEYETTVVFEELGVYRILWELKESTAMGSFYTENLKQLIDYDSKNKAELVKTIDTYYKNNGNLEKTADMLFIHKNTVSYRLRKAEAIIGKKLSDYSVILDLQLCLKFKNFL